MKLPSMLHLRRDLFNRISLGKVYIIVSILNVIFFTTLWLLFPATRNSLTAENEFLENLTTIFYVETFVVGLIFISRLRDKKAQKIYLIIPFLGLLAALNEISFGYRIFWFTAPIVGGVRIDALHDVFFLLLVTVKPILKQNKMIFLIILGGLACVLLIGLLLAPKYSHKVKRIIEQGLSYFTLGLNRYPPLGFLLIAVGYGIVSILIDLDIVINEFLHFLEELIEMNAALTLLFSSFSIRIRSQCSQ